MTEHSNNWTNFIPW